MKHRAGAPARDGSLSSWLGRLRRVCLLAGGVLGALGACTERSAPEVAHRAVAEHQRLFNAGEYVRIYDGADAELTRTSSATATALYLANKKRLLGEFRRAEEATTRIENRNGTRFTVVHQRSRYEHCAVTEEFWFRVDADGAALAGNKLLWVGELPEEKPERGAASRRRCAL